MGELYTSTAQRGSMRMIDGSTAVCGSIFISGKLHGRDALRRDFCLKAGAA